MDAKLEIDIDVDGSVVTRTKGIVGPKCTDPDSFMKELGTVETKFTEDYYRKPKPNEVLLNGLG